MTVNEAIQKGIRGGALGSIVTGRSSHCLTSMLAGAALESSLDAIKENEAKKIKSLNRCCSKSTTKIPKNFEIK